MEKGTREKAIPNEDESTVKFTSVRPHCPTVLYTVAVAVVGEGVEGRGQRE